MNMKKSIRSQLPIAIERTKKKMLSDPFYEDIAREKEKIEEIIDLQADMLIRYTDSSTLDEQLCLSFFKRVSLPYIVVIKSVKMIKKELIYLLQNQNEKNQEEIILEVERFVDDLINLIAKSYLKKESIKLLDDQKQHSRFENFLLFRSHKEWLEQISAWFQQNESVPFPAIDAKSCLFSKVLQYPESLMVCMDAKLCAYLHTLHELLHESATTAYRYAVNHEYSQAFFMLKELLEIKQKFESTLKNLYYLTYADLESSFFKLIDLYTYTDKRQILTLIDIEGLKHLNEIHGEDTLNEILDHTEKTLRQFIHPYESSVLLVRGLSTNFYMLNLEWPQEKYEKFFQEIGSVLPTSMKVKDININFSYIMAAFELDPDLKYTHEELIRIMWHLKSRSKIQRQNLKIFSEEQKSRIQEWLKEKYYNIDFIKRSLAESAVEVLFQPIVESENRKIVAIEALARIKHGNELLNAGAFIDTIYEMNKIVELDIQVLEALRQKISLLHKFDGMLLVNTSPQSLSDSDYIGKLREFVDEIGAKNVIFEITEQQALQNIETIKSLHKEEGIHFAIDDFGSGYSALKTVADLTENGMVKLIKIDGSLIQNIDKNEHACKIVEVIVKMCKTLQAQSLGEFVENEKIAKKLEALKANFQQGYFFSPAIRLEEVMLQEHLPTQRSQAFRATF